MKKFKKILVILLIIVIVCTAAMIGFAVYTIVTCDYDITNVPSSISVMIADPVKTRQNQEAQLNWYDSVDEAMQDTSILEKQDKSRPKGKYEILFQIQGKEQLTVFYLNEEQVAKDQPGYGHVSFYMENGKFSQPYSSDWNFFYPTDTGGFSYTYDFDDWIAELIIRECTYLDTVISESGNQVFYGVTDNEDAIRSMTIKGREPDEIIPFESEGEGYYFWYYTDLDIEAELESIDYSRYTLGEVIELVEIRYDHKEED